MAVKAGDIGIDGGILSLKKGIEVGHIFQLGQKYSRAMNATFLDENGKATHFVMGCYGIGVSRLIAAMVEQNHDERGIIWQKQCAPFDLHIIVGDVKNEKQMSFASKLESELESAGFEVLLDDRNERFGVKMADFELIGIPNAIIIAKSLENEQVEIITRKNLIKEKIPANQAKIELEKRLKA